MTKDEKEYLDQQLEKLLIENAGVAMSVSAIAKECGVSEIDIHNIELKAMRKLRTHPIAWEAVTAAYRTPEVE